MSPLSVRRPQSRKAGFAKPFSPNAGGFSIGTANLAHKTLNFVKLLQFVTLQCLAEKARRFELLGALHRKTLLFATCLSNEATLALHFLLIQQVIKASDRSRLRQSFKL